MSTPPRMGLILLTVSAFLAGTADHTRAAVTITGLEVGGDVVFTGSGSFNLLALTFDGGDEGFGGLRGDRPAIILGADPLAAVAMDTYADASLDSPDNFGTGSLQLADDGTGDRFGAVESALRVSLLVPTGYISGSPLSGTSTYTGTTIADMGLTPGTYVWSWGDNGEADSMTLVIVPEPASGVMLLCGIGAVMMRRRRA